MEKNNFVIDDIEVIGASENNLKHIDVTIPVLTQTKNSGTIHRKNGSS